VIDLIVVRVLFLLILVAIAYYLQPFELSAPISALVALSLGIVLVLGERRLKDVSLKRLVGASVGIICCVATALLVSLIIEHAGPSDSNGTSTASFLQLATLIAAVYIGFSVGASKGEMLNLSALGGVMVGDKPGRQHTLILDTSVIIDGRIADIAETGFLSGTLAVPQFVLRELQFVADSADSL
jgi:uncharacterized protein YacL